MAMAFEDVQIAHGVNHNKQDQQNGGTCQAQTIIGDFQVFGRENGSTNFLSKKIRRTENPPRHFQKKGNEDLTGPLHPGRLTWNIIMEVWKIIFLSRWVICRFHVNLPGCKTKGWQFSKGKYFFRRLVGSHHLFFRGLSGLAIIVSRRVFFFNSSSFFGGYVGGEVTETVHDKSFLLSNIMIQWYRNDGVFHVDGHKHALKMLPRRKLTNVPWQNSGWTIGSQKISRAICFSSREQVQVSYLKTVALELSLALVVHVLQGCLGLSDLDCQGGSQQALEKRCFRHPKCLQNLPTLGVLVGYSQSHGPKGVFSPYSWFSGKWQEILNRNNYWRRTHFSLKHDFGREGTLQGINISPLQVA